jgi:polyhydroxyalkanoate synthesis repressor PhaR
MDSTSTVAAENTARIIKKYPNRRLYDTTASAYVTLNDVKKLVMAQQQFTVVDAKSNEDLTHSVLLQIIIDEETQGVHLLSSNALSEIIRYYGHAMQGMLGAFLEKNIQVISDIQEKFSEEAGDVSQNATAQSEEWMQFMVSQGPAMQHMMQNYIEQSKDLFIQMQNRTQNAA